MIDRREPHAHAAANLLTPFPPSCPHPPIPHSLSLTSVPRRASLFSLFELCPHHPSHLIFPRPDPGALPFSPFWPGPCSLSFLVRSHWAFCSLAARLISHLPFYSLGSLFLFLLPPTSFLFSSYPFPLPLPTNPPGQLSPPSSSRVCAPATVNSLFFFFLPFDFPSLLSLLSHRNK